MSMLNAPLSASNCFTTLASGEVVGLGVIAQSGLTSMVAVFVLLSLAARKGLRYVLRPRQGERPRWTSLDAYFFSMLLADVVHSTGSMISLQWSLRSMTHCSTLCTLQGVLEQLGLTAGALTMLTMILHTTLTTCLGWKGPPGQVWFTILILIWAYPALFITASWYRLTDPPLFEPAPYCQYFLLRCWIGQDFLIQRIFGQYFWMWLSASLCTILSAPIIVCIRGQVIFTAENGRRLSLVSYSDYGDEGSGSESIKILWFLLTYPLLVVPYSIVRWITFNRISNGQSLDGAPFTFTVITASLINFSGLIHVLLFWYQRPSVLFFSPGNTSSQHCPPPVHDNTEKRPFSLIPEPPILPLVAPDSPAFNGVEEGDARAYEAVARWAFKLPSLDLSRTLSKKRQSSKSGLTKGTRISKPLPPIPPAYQISTTFSRSRASLVTFPADARSIRSVSEGWWEMAELRSVWLQMLPKRNSSATLPGGLVRPDSVILAPTTSRFSHDPISPPPTAWRF